VQQAGSKQVILVVVVVAVVGCRRDLGVQQASCY